MLHKSKLRHKSFFLDGGNYNSKQQHVPPHSDTDTVQEKSCASTNTHSHPPDRLSAVAPPAASLSASLTFKGFEHRKNEKIWRCGVLLSSTQHSLNTIVLLCITFVYLLYVHLHFYFIY